MTTLFVCETHQHGVEAYETTVSDLTAWVHGKDHQGVVKDKMLNEPILNPVVHDILEFDTQNLIIEYELKKFFVECEKKGETYGAFFRAVSSHKFIDDVFEVEHNPYSNQYMERSGRVVETGNPVVIRVCIFDDSRDVLVSELLTKDPSSTAIGDIEFYEHFQDSIEEEIDTILTEYED